MKRRLRLSAFLAVALALTGLDSFAANGNENFFDDVLVRDELSLKGRPIYFDNEEYADAWHDKWEANGMEGINNYLPEGGRLHYLYLDNRRALTGESCNINQTVNQVVVGGATIDLGNILDDDLTNYGEVDAGVNADVTVGPVLSVRDKSCYYAKGTTAGFTIVAGSGDTALSLSVIQAMAIGFYRDGKLVGTAAVSNGQNAGGVSLSLVNIPGSSDTGFDIEAEAPAVFDEISLDLAGGIQAGVGRVLRIKYAYVGKPSQSKIRRTTEEGYVLDNIKGYNPVILGLPFPFDKSQYDKFLSDDDTEGAIMSPVLGLAFLGSIEYVMKDPKDEVREVYEAGSDVTFEYRFVGVLSLELGSYMQIELLDRKGKTVQTSRVEAGVLALDVVQVGKQAVTISSSVPFSGAKLSFYGGLKVGTGGISVVGSYVRDKADIRHHCPIDPTGSTSACSDQSSFQLRSNPDISVTWEIVDQPEGSSAQVTPSGKVTNMFMPGEYVFRATAADGCFDETTITIWDENNATNQETCGLPLWNTPDGFYGTYEVRQVSDSSHGGLIPIDVLDGQQYIIDDDPDTYATFTGVNVLDNCFLVGIQRTDDVIYDAEREIGSTGKRIGLLVSSPVEVLNLNVLQFVQIRCYYQGKEVYRNLVDESNAVSADVGGANANLKMRYSVAVPDIDDHGAPTKIDAIELWTSGLIGITDKLNIYYAFIEDLPNKSSSEGGNNGGGCNSPFGCQTDLLGFDTTHTTLDFNQMNQGAAINAITGVKDLDALVDGNWDTYCRLYNTLGSSGTVFYVKLGRTLDFRQKLGFVVDDKTFLAGVGVGGWLTIETYYNGIPTGNKYTDWNAVDANVAGYGDKRVLFINPTAPYNEVKVTIANVLNLVDYDSKYYGFGVLSDIDNDGLADCRDTNSCHSDIGGAPVGEVCSRDVIDIVAHGNPDTDYYISYGRPGDTPFLVRTDINGKLEVSFETAGPGMYTMMFYDGSMKPINTLSYVVHPEETTWKKNASNNDWSKWDNWTNGTPYCCTNVIIPAGARIYPDLVAAEENHPDLFCCDNIHFEPGAEINSIQNLNYSKAWVELELTPNRYHLLSAPMKDMVTGDMFVPEAMKGIHTAPYFTELNEQTAPQNRFNPTIYQRRWYSAVQDRLWSQNPDNMYRDLVELEQIDGMTTTLWSKNFNLLNYGYRLGEGFSLWVDNGELPESTDFRFRFPKTQTEYVYYNDFTGLPIDGVSESISRDEANTSRFIYEDAENMETSTFKTTICEREYDRTVFNGAADITINVKADDNTDYFLFGNPFMSSINVEKFIEANKDAISGVMAYDGNTISTVRRAASGAFAKTAPLATIAPMQAVFVIANSDAKSLDLKMNPEMLMGSGIVGDEETDEPSIATLRVRLRDGVHEAATIVADAYDCPTNIALLDNEVAPSLAVMAMSEGICHDITPTADRIPLTILKDTASEAWLDFNAYDDFNAEGYELLDVAENKTYNLNEQVCIPAGTSASAGRYVLVRKTGVSTIVDIINENNSGVYAEVINGEIRIISNGNNISDILISDIAGSVVAEKHSLNESELTLSVGKGIRIVSVMTSESERPAVFKLLVP